MPFVYAAVNGNMTLSYVETRPTNYIVLGGTGTTYNFATTYDGITYNTSYFASVNHSPNMMTGYNYCFAYYSGGQNNGPVISKSGSEFVPTLTWQDTLGMGGQQVNGAGFYRGSCYAGGYNTQGISYSSNPVSVNWTNVAITSFVCAAFYAFKLNGVEYALAANLNGGNWIYYSTTGTSWTASNANTVISNMGYNYNAVNNPFGSSSSMVLAIGVNGASPTAIYSTNCSTWASCTFSPALTGAPNGVAYGNGTWMICTQTASTLWVSTNGTAFTSTITVPLTTINTISFVNNTWIIGGSGTTSNIYYSKNNGASWSPASINIGTVKCSATAVKD